MLNTTRAPSRPAPPFAAMAAVLCLVGIVVVGQMYATIPLIPYLAGAWSVDPAAAAWATSAFAIAYACGSLISGPLSNRWGRRAVMVGGIAAMAVVTAVLPLADSLVTGSVLRGLQGLFAGAFVPMAYAHFSATVPARRLPTALTMISASMGGTVVIGQVESQLVAQYLGWRAVFWVTAALLVPAVVIVYRVMHDPDGQVPVAGRVHGTVPTLVRRAPLYLIALLVAGSITAVYTGVQLAGPVELVSDHDAMLALRTSALPALLLAVFLAPVLGRFPSTIRVCAAFALAAAGMAGTAIVSDSPLGIGIALFLFMLGMSTAGPALIQSIGTNAGAAQTTAIAFYGFALNAGGAVGARLPTSFPDLAELAWVLTAVLLAATAYLLRSALRARTTTFRPVEPRVPATGPRRGARSGS
ncbi:MFS transporter [Actinokineospora globicatena]|uniref:MFS transporter n=1 Tax=Actinokineospora globicatena TaxID=103729 RepID=A0A9W6V7V9_9PSEU|nr:MFS transporter [Actinokineospora globicatena]GLW90334.1 MFS transporter [Actinokineospora globicatena]